MSLLVKQVRIVDGRSPHHGDIVDLLIQDGIVSAIGDQLEAAGIDVWHREGACIAPGFVDLFADYCEPGFEHHETISSGLQVARAGGYTDVFVVPNTKPATCNKAAIQFLINSAEGAATNILPLGAVSQDLEGKALAEMLDMRLHGAIAFTDGWKSIQSAGLLMKALEYVRAFDGVIIQIPLDLSVVAGGLMHEGALSTRLGMLGVPTLAETTMLYRDIELLRYTSSKLHITGVSTAASVNMIRNAKMEGLSVTCSVTPYHLALTDQSLESYDSLYKVTPVLREESDRRALIAGLADGTIDCVASHHRPRDWDAKAREFEYAADGIAIQELAFPIVWRAVAGAVDLERVVDAFSTAPRRIFGLANDGVQEGAPAAFTLFHPQQTTRLNQVLKKSASANNPFLNLDLPGKVLGIYSKNRLHLNE